MSESSPLQNPLLQLFASPTVIPPPTAIVLPDRSVYSWRAFVRSSNCSEVLTKPLLGMLMMRNPFSRGRTPASALPKSTRTHPRQFSGMTYRSPAGLKHAAMHKRHVTKTAFIGCTQSCIARRCYEPTSDNSLKKCRELKCRVASQAASSVPAAPSWDMGQGISSASTFPGTRYRHPSFCSASD